MKKSILILIAATLFGSPAAAQMSVPNTFTPNTPANAEDVNANFSALVTAINNLDGRVAALEQGGGGGPLTMADLAGAWTVYGLESENGARDDSDGGVTGGFLVESILTLDANGTFSVTDTGTGVRVLTAVFKSPCDFNVPQGAQCVSETQIDEILESDVEGDSGTWSLSGQTITLVFPGDPGEPDENQSATVTPDGNLLVTTFTEDESFAEQGSTMRSRILSLAVGVRTVAN